MTNVPLSGKQRQGRTIQKVCRHQLQVILVIDIQGCSTRLVHFYLVLHGQAWKLGRHITGKMAVTTCKKTTQNAIDTVDFK